MVERVLVEFPRHCPAAHSRMAKCADHEAQRRATKPVELRTNLRENGISHPRNANAYDRDAALSGLFREDNREAAPHRRAAPLVAVTAAAEEEPGRRRPSQRGSSGIQVSSSPRCFLIVATSLRISGSFSIVQSMRTCSLCASRRVAENLRIGGDIPRNAALGQNGDSVPNCEVIGHPDLSRHDNVIAGGG